MERLTTATILLSTTLLLILPSNVIIINDNLLSQTHPFIASTLLLKQISSFDSIAITTSNTEPDSSALNIQSSGFSMISSSTDLGDYKGKVQSNGNIQNNV